MPAGFRAAEAWVEVTTSLDGSQLERAAYRAAERVDDALTRGVEGTGEQISETLGRSGDKGGERLVRSVEGRMRDSRGRFVAAGSAMGDAAGLSAGSKLGASMIKASIPVIAANAPTAGAAMAGGISAGLAVGTIGLGIALAMKDPIVQREATRTGQEIGDTLKGAADPFKAELIGVFDQGRSAFARWAPDLRSIFSSAAGYLRPLSTGLENMGNELIPGVRDAVASAEPPVNALRMTFERLGDASGDVLSQMAEDADEGASALNDLGLAAENAVRAVGLITHGAAAIKGWADQADIAIDKGRGWVEQNSYVAEKLRSVGIQLDLTADGFAAGSREAAAYQAATTGVATASDFAVLKQAGMTDAQITGIDASGRYRAATTQTTQSLNALRGSTQTAIPGVRTLGQIMDDYAGQTIDAERANMRLESAIDDATAAAKRNKDKGIDPNTRAGRENRSALLDIAAASREASAKILAQTGSQEKASAANERGRAKFLALAGSMGVSSKEAKALADKLFGIPAERKPKVTVQDAQAKAALAAIKSGIATIHSKTVTVTVKYETRGSVQGEHTIGVGTNTKYQRWGGVTEYAQDGLLRDAKMFSATAGPARYGFAEPATGGEAFIPRNGDPRKSLPVLERAANWYGQTLSGGSAPAQHFHFAEGSIVLDASKIRDVADLARMVQDLVPAARSMMGARA